MKKSLTIAALLTVTLLLTAVIRWIANYRGNPVGRLSFFPDGKNIAVGSSRSSKGDIYIVSTDGASIERITAGPPFSAWPALSPDGKWIYCALMPTDLATSQLYAMRIDGSNRHRLTSNDWCDTAPAGSSDGKTVIFSRAQLHRPYSMGGYVWSNWDVWLMNADGTGQVPLTHNQYYGLGAPRLAPNGSYALFSATSNQQPQDRIFRIDLDKSNQASAPREMQIGQAPPQEHRDIDPSFSLDGKSITFISDREIPFNYEVWVSDSGGSNPKQITHIHSMCSSSVFSPDGTLIYFLSDPSRSGAMELWRVQSDGVAAHQVRGGL